MINKESFYKKIRVALFDKLTQSQVDGMEAILTEWERGRESDLRPLAYMLATVYHETAKTMQPIKEFGGDAYFVRRYWENKKVANQLGNKSAADAINMCGKGFVQLTGRRNYELASKKLGQDFVKNPDSVMELENATKILFKGMAEGWFTGRKLSDYIGLKCDFVGARKIINGTDKASTIASYANGFLTALS